MASALIAATVLSAITSLAPSALADPAANFKDAVASARGETSCKPLQYNAVVEQAAEVINRSTDAYLNHVATRVPIDDPREVLEGLKDLGYRATKAILLRGASRSEALAIKGALLEGYAAIPDCSYTDFGLNVRRNEANGYILTSLVLAGP
ncbi:hypothetical protein [Mycobacterium sp. MFM001]|uniref:hypothetical protein n=1 Tax=Mycobacterium sp. MFM001 TaxID=2049453 RepID=UPI001EDE1D3A|nr:hypothetical protein [Mycobacterium sp. MFM001]